MSKESLHMVNFRMTRAEIERLDKIAEYCGVSRSQLLYNMTTAGMDDFDFFKSIGVMASLRTVRDVIDVLKGSTKELENIDNDDAVKA